MKRLTLILLSLFLLPTAFAEAADGYTFLGIAE